MSENRWLPLILKILDLGFGLRRPGLQVPLLGQVTYLRPLIPIYEKHIRITIDRVLSRLNEIMDREVSDTVPLFQTLFQTILFVFFPFTLLIYFENPFSPINSATTLDEHFGIIGNFKLLVYVLIRVSYYNYCNQY